MVRIRIKHLLWSTGRLSWGTVDILVNSLAQCFTCVCDRSRHWGNFTTLANYFAHTGGERDSKLAIPTVCSFSHWSLYLFESLHFFAGVTRRLYRIVIRPWGAQALFMAMVGGPTLAVVYNASMRLHRWLCLVIVLLSSLKGISCKVLGLWSSIFARNLCRLFFLTNYIFSHRCRCWIVAMKLLGWIRLKEWGVAQLRIIHCGCLTDIPGSHLVSWCHVYLVAWLLVLYLALSS